VDEWIKCQERDYSTAGAHEASTGVERGASRMVAILKEIKNGEKVLELGCNDGGLTNEIAKQGNDVLGVDLPQVIEIAKNGYPHLNFLAFDLSQEFPWEDKSFDLVIAPEIIEHMVDDILFLKRCYRALNEKGRLIITTPNMAYIRTRIRLLRGKYSEGETHIHQYTFATLRKKLEECGFRIIKGEGLEYNTSPGFWYRLERILPKAFKSGIFIVAQVEK